METHKHLGYNAWQKRGDDVRALIQRLQIFRITRTLSESGVILIIKMVDKSQGLLSVS